MEGTIPQKYELIKPKMATIEKPEYCTNGQRSHGVTPLFTVDKTKSPITTQQIKTCKA